MARSGDHVNRLLCVTSSIDCLSTWGIQSLVTRRFPFGVGAALSRFHDNEWPYGKNSPGWQLEPATTSRKYTVHPIIYAQCIPLSFCGYHMSSWLANCVQNSWGVLKETFSPWKKQLTVTNQAITETNDDIVHQCRYMSCHDLLR